MIHITVMMLMNMLLIGECAPVEALTLLLAYPPNAGRDMKHPPTTLAKPKATISLLGLTCIPFTPLFGTPVRPLAATDDSKKPRSAMINAVLNAARICSECLG